MSDIPRFAANTVAVAATAITTLPGQTGAVALLAAPATPADGPPAAAAVGLPRAAAASDAADASHDGSRLPERHTRAETLSPAFTWAFWVVVAFTAIAVGGLALLVVFMPRPIDSLGQDLIGIFDFMAKAGFGAIVGLIGGKAAA